MNLFLLDVDLKKCAQFHCNKHVVKMILELTQILYTCWWVSIENNDWITQTPNQKPYKKSHVFHPTAMWCRLNKDNYNYVINLALELSKEYTYRYKRIHACHKHIIALQSLGFPTPQYPHPKPKKQSKIHRIAIINVPKEIKNFPLCMPDECLVSVQGEYDAVNSYRKYYHVKSWALKWKNRDIPSWYEKSI